MVIILNKYIPTWSSRLQTAVKSMERHILNCFVNYKLMNTIPGTQIQFTWLLKCHNRFQLSGRGNWKHVTRSSFSYRCNHILLTLKRRNITKMTWAWFSVAIRHGLTVAQLISFWQLIGRLCFRCTPVRTTHAHAWLNYLPSRHWTKKIRSSARCWWTERRV